MDGTETVGLQQGTTECTDKKTRIIVNLQFEGVHCWPGCTIEEVMYLRNPHRHMFHVCCKKYVSHDDRDIEIIQFKHRILGYIERAYPLGQLGSTSCEMLANELASRFSLCYCSVLEDGENGAEVIREPVAAI